MTAVSPRTQLRIVNTVIIVGLFPSAFLFGWTTLFFLTNTNGEPAHIAMPDPLGMVGLMFMSLVWTVAVATPFAFWSRSLTNEHPALRSRSATLLRWMTVAVLAWPVLFIAYINIEPR